MPTEKSDTNFSTDNLESVCQTFFEDNWITEEDIPDSIQDMQDNFQRIFRHKMEAKSLKSEIMQRIGFALKNVKFSNNEFLRF